jgi:hypothetical protein
MQEINLFQAQRNKEGEETQPTVAEQCRERPQTPWYMGMENKGAGQEPMEEDPAGGQDPDRVVVSAKKKIRAASYVTRISVCTVCVISSSFL